EPIGEILAKMADRLEAQASENLSRLSDEELPRRQCWRCQGKGWQPVGEGGRAGVRLGLCQRRNILTSFRIPPVFKRPALGRLRPRDEMHPKQKQAISVIKAQPEASYLFAGKNGCGKTHLCWALARAALIRGNRVRGLLLSELIGQYREWEM